MKKFEFKVVERDQEFCLHDTGVGHSPRIACINAERMTRMHHMSEDDPLHDEIWHKDDNQGAQE